MNQKILQTSPQSFPRKRESTGTLRILALLRHNCGFKNLTNIYKNLTNKNLTNIYTNLQSYKHSLKILNFKKFLHKPLLSLHPVVRGFFCNGHIMNMGFF